MANIVTKDMPAMKSIALSISNPIRPAIMIPPKTSFDRSRQ